MPLTTSIALIDTGGGGIGQAEYAGRSVYRRNSILLSVATGVVGATFGVLAACTGVSLPSAMALSAFVFTGASQFAAVTVIGSGGTEIAAVTAGLVLALRNALYGPAVVALFPPSLAKKLGAAHFVIDETTAMATAQPDPDTARKAFWTTAIWLWVLWNLGTVIGVVAGETITDPDRWGLDAAFPAAFVALIIPHLRTIPGRAAALAGAAVALAVFPFVPAGVPILASSAGVLAGVAMHRRST